MRNAQFELMISKDVFATSDMKETSMASIHLKKQVITSSQVQETL